MPATQSVNPAVITSTAKSDDSSVTKNSISTKLTEGLNAAAEIFASIKLSKPDKAEAFMQAFKRLIDEIGIAALLVLKKLAKQALTAVGINNENVVRESFASIVSAPAGFLWKPVADSPPHGLAVLTPTEWTGKIVGLEVLSADGKEVLVKGRDGGVGNGDRQHFRFSQKGADFADGSLVRVKFNDGSSRLIRIEDTSARIEGR